MELVVALVSDLHFGPQASFGGKLRKLTHQAASLTERFVSKMNLETEPDVVVTTRP